MGYDYRMLNRDIEGIAQRYVFAEIFEIGESVEGRGIYAVKVGEGDKKVLVSAAHHALEYITSALLMRFIEDMCARVLRQDTDFAGFPVKRLYSECSLYCLPMINPDGINLSLNGADMDNPYHRSIIERTGIHNFANVWQANINGVDLNHNYDAQWQSIKEGPSPSRWGGPYPESEPETRAAVNFVRSMNFDMLAALHSQGREIYYDFNGLTASRSREIGEKLAGISGYTLSRPEGAASFGGFKDWFIQEFGREGFTVEVGLGKNPLPMSLLDGEYDAVAGIILTLLNEV